MAPESKLTRNHHNNVRFFIFAAKDGRVDLLKTGSKRQMNYRDYSGMTPVHWAAACGHLEALRCIVGRGGDVDTVDRWGRSPLHHAVLNDKLNCVTFLVNFGCNVWLIDLNDQTALQVAAEANHEHILRFLDYEMGKQDLLHPKSSQQKREKASKSLRKMRAKLQKEGCDLNNKSKMPDYEHDIDYGGSMCATITNSCTAYNWCMETHNSGKSLISDGETFISNDFQSLARRSEITNANPRKLRRHYDLLHTLTSRTLTRLGLVHNNNNKQQQVEGAASLYNYNDEDSRRSNATGCSRSLTRRYFGGSLNNLRAADVTAAPQRQSAITTEDVLYMDKDQARHNIVSPRMTSSLFDRPGFGSVSFLTFGINPNEHADLVICQDRSTNEVMFDFESEAIHL